MLVLYDSHFSVPGSIALLSTLQMDAWNIPLKLIHYNEMTLIHIPSRHDSSSTIKKLTIINGEISHCDIYLIIRSIRLATSHKGYHACIEADDLNVEVKIIFPGDVCMSKQEQEAMAFIFLGVW
jgi:hypothetical protein